MHAMEDPLSFPASDSTNIPCETNDLVNRFIVDGRFDYKDIYEEVCAEKAKLEETLKQYDDELSKAYYEIRMLKSIIRAIEAVTGKHIYD